MNQVKSSFLKPKKKYPLVILVIALGILVVAKISGVIINITPSMAEGIYIKTRSEIKIGNIVAVCLKEPYKALGLKKQYIMSGTRCAGSDPLIKQVIAVPGDNVVLTDHYIAVNGINYPYPTFHTDSAGRKPVAFPRGNYLKTTGYWLIGTHAPNSWDSRYWGMVNKDQIIYKLKPILTW